MDDNFIHAKEVAKMLEVSDSYGYKVVKELNAELRKKGYITVSGRVNRKYFLERFYEGKEN